MKILVIADQGQEPLAHTLAREISRESPDDRVAAHTGREIDFLLTNDGPFDAVVVCHAHLRDLLAYVTGMHPRIGLVLYSTNEEMTGCPPGTVWVEKPAGIPALVVAIRAAIANRATG